MNKEIYDSALSKLSIVAPLFAKTLLDNAIKKRAKTLDELSVIDLFDILKREISPKLSREKTTHVSVMFAGAGIITYNLKKKILHKDKFARGIISQLRANSEHMREMDDYRFLEHHGFLRTPAQLEIFEFLHNPNGHNYQIIIAPMFIREQVLTGYQAIIQDVTLNVSLENEVLRQSRRLEKEMKQRLLAESELKENQAKMIDQAKMASLGVMAGGIAHEINTPLGAITLGLDLLVNDLKKAGIDMSEGLERRVDLLFKASDKISSIIDSMKRLIRDEEVSDEIVNVKNVLSDILELSNEKMNRAGIEFITDIDAANIRCNITETELGQVLFSILNNAIDAMEDSSDKKLTLVCKQTATSLEIEIRDRGTGIAENALDKIFDPFFTTKPAGKGTGLGLSLGRKIIEQYHGQLSIRNVSPGCEVTITLPLSSEDKI